MGIFIEIIGFLEIIDSIVYSNLNALYCNLDSGDLNLKKEQIQQILIENFVEFWPIYLLSEINRFRKMTEAAGSPTDAHIMQVVAWSYLLTTTLDQNMEEKDFQSVLSAWNVGLQTKQDKTNALGKRLTVSSIAHQTSIAFETVRRRVAKLEEKGFITNSRAHGILLNPQSEFNREIVQELHPMEQKSIVNLFHFFCGYMNEQAR
jgi:hypothetical protein